jgi:carboxymethylenebutenolidase
MTDAQQNVTFPSNGDQAHGFLQLPPGGTGPGVIVIQEWWGLTTHMADVTRRLAAEGFVALAPDLYGGSTTHDAGEAMDLMQKLPADRAARDLAGAVDYLLARPETSSTTVGVIGFCMGGGFALALAAHQGAKVTAAVPFYGLPQDTDVSTITAAVQGHYGEKDDHVPLDAVRAAFAAIPDGELHTYEAGHAFYNDENLLGTYDHDVAELAFGRAVTFLREHVA